LNQICACGINLSRQFIWQNGLGKNYLLLIICMLSILKL